MTCVSWRPWYEIDEFSFFRSLKSQSVSFVFLHGIMEADLMHGSWLIQISIARQEFCSPFSYLWTFLCLTEQNISVKSVVLIVSLSFQILKCLKVNYNKLVIKMLSEVIFSICSFLHFPSFGNIIPAFIQVLIN